MRKVESVTKQLKIGEYEPVKVEKGVNETTLPLKEGEIFWMVNCETQTEAEIISRLIRIEKLLKRKWKQEK